MVGESTELKHPDLAESEVVFFASHARATIPMRMQRDRVLETGTRQVIDPGHEIRFEEFRYTADNVRKIQTQNGKNMTEAEFLVDVFLTCEEDGGVQVWPASEARPDRQTESDRQASRSVLAVLGERTATELRSLFTEAEIRDKGLAKAAVPTLAFHVMMSDKQIPSEWMEATNEDR